MNCYLHADVEAGAYCRSCGRPLCASCLRLAEGTVYCEEHAPVAAPAVAPAAGRAGGVSPGLAFILGFIPGVGAIYNGQYVKGLVHVVILGTLISILESNAVGGFEPLFGLLTALWFFYMAFEAYHTAGKRLRGEPVDEFSSLMPLRSPRANSTAGPIALILLGGLFMVMTTKPEWTRQIFRMWPAALIVAGAYMLVCRLRSRAGQDASPQEAPHERL